MDLKDKILQNLSTNHWFQDVKVVIDSGSILEGSFEGYSVNSKGLLLYKGSVYIPELGDLRNMVMVEAHKAPYLAHPYVKKMYADLK